MKRYILTADTAALEEVSEYTFLSLFGDEAHRGYVSAVYKGEMALDAVPEEYRETVATIVANCTARWGDYADWPVHGSGKLTDILLGEVTPMKRKDAQALREIIENNAQATSADRTDDENIRVSVLYPKWAEGKHTKGEIYNADGQTWECFQDYDNKVYPDIKPGNAAWYTFNRPLHGKTRETARPWVQPMGAHDMYHAGEWMIYTDDMAYLCKQDTNFSPEEYAAAWENGDGLT